MREKLIDRWFGPAAVEERKKESQADSQDISAIHEFVTREGYRMFRDDLKTLIKSHEPRPDTHDGMLYSVGKWDGLKTIVELLDTWEARVVESKNAD